MTTVNSQGTTFYSAKSPVLLTGAGFSKPFGGYLAAEMWSLIFNQPVISTFQKLRQLLLDNLNYEEVYDRISTEMSTPEKNAFTEALQNAYGELDRSICAYLANNRAYSSCIRYFVNRFMGEGSIIGFIFTLNQDLLLERHYLNEAGLLQIPAFGHPDWFSPRLDTNQAPTVELPDPLKIEKFRQAFWSKGSGLQNFLYIKLHGSYTWVSPGNQHAMVIGYEKEGSIAKEPLLRWYLELFEEILNVPNQTLVVVGYGFMDSHINNIIANAGKKGLKLHVISPMQPSKFKQMLLSLHGFAGGKFLPHGQEIWQMLHGYHCGSLESLIPPNSSELSGTAQAFFQHVGLG